MTAKTILIVEDDELNMQMFNSLLQSNGYNTIKSSCGSDILELAYKHRPDLIVMDILLPERSGLELTKILKADEKLKAIPIFAVTAFAMKDDEKRIRDAGCDDYLAKPISVPAFLARVENHLL